MTTLHLDFETRSTVDLKRRGLHVYAADPSTEILCMAYAFDDEPVQLWKPGTRFPLRVEEHLRRQVDTVYAHNAAFEATMFRCVLGIDLRRSQFRCTMAMAYAMGLPGSLDGASAAVGLAQRKDNKGHRLMLQLSKPRRVEPDGTVVWWDDPDKLEQLYAYCKQDVEVERALHHRLMELSGYEQRLWVVDQAINDRGVAIDRAAAETALLLVEGEKKRLDKAMRAATGGAVATCTAVGQLTDWLRLNGVETDGVGAPALAALLERDDLPEIARSPLLLRQEAAKSSTAKLKAMLDRAGSDGRMRGLFQYHGAATGRWAARGPQLQNLPRPSILKSLVHCEDVFKNLGHRDWLDMAYGSPLQVVSDALRGFIVPAKGHEFIACDFSNIEGRVLAWLAGETWKLDAFRAFDRGIGHDLYLIAASRIYRCEPEEARPHRQIGKVSELALGFGGGVSAFQRMASAYGVEIEDEAADTIKHAWREAHPEITRFWGLLEGAAINAVRAGGTWDVEAHQPAGLTGRNKPQGLIRFKKSGSFLWCQLPSKRVLCYPYPEVADKEVPWSTPEKPAYRPALSYMTVNSLTRKWERCDTYGGSLAENVTQAVARDLLADAILRCEAQGLHVVMHVHDEIVVEAPVGACTLDKLSRIMTDSPAWAAGLPVAVSGWVGNRYRKD